MKQAISALLSAAVAFGYTVFPTAATQQPISGTAIDGKYSWSFSDISEAGTYDYSDECAAIRVGLGNGDSMSENGISYSGPSCKETNASGYTSVEDTGRYILIKPEYSGTLYIKLAFSDAKSSQKGRIWYNEFSDFDSVDLSSLKKGVGTQIGSDFTNTYASTVSFEVAAGTTYSLHTYNCKSSISELYYTSDSIVGKTVKPEINTPIIDSDSEISGSCTDGAAVNVSINGKSAQPAEVSGTEWHFSVDSLNAGDKIAVTAKIGDYLTSDAAEAEVMPSDSICRLTINDTENSTVTSDQPNNDRIIKGSTVTLTAAPADRYRLAELVVGGATAAADDNGKYSFTITEDTEVNAVFEEKPHHAISMPAEIEHGSISVSSGAELENGVLTAVEGEIVKFDIQADDGYRIDSLSYTGENGGTTEFKYGAFFEMPTEDVVVSAEFKPAAIMSCVDTSLEKYDRLTLTVDGEPFFYNGIQVRADNAKDQLKFSDEQIKEMYLQAGKDGYTVVNSQVRWSDVQPDTEIWAGETGQLTDGERVSSAESGTVSGTSGNESTAYFTFELPELDSDCAAAKFRIRVSSISAAASLSVSDADGVSDAVIEAPSWRIVNALSLKGASEGGSNGYFDINVADIVNAHKGDSSVTLAVTTTAESTVTVYGAAAEGNNRPLLKLSRDDVYDWTYLDKLLDYAYEAGVKFELLWFATDTCQQSHELRLPYYVHENYQKSLKADGTPARNLNATNTYIMCKNDPYLRAKEKEVLETVFDHIAEYDAAHGSSKLVVGCQVANETAVGRLHSGTTEDRYFGHCYCDTCLAKLAASESEVSFREDTLWGYLNNLASAVKDSDYSVWTRENNYMTTDTNVLAYNEKQRSTVGTDLDFIGLDPYSAVSGADNNYLYSFGHESCTYKNHTYNYAQGKNLPLVMEYGGNNKNLDQAIIACLAGGANLNVYELLSGKENFGTYVAVRDADGNATGFEPRTSYTYASGSDANWSEENWIERIRSLNTMLGKVKHQLASLKPDGVGGDKLVYFNPKSDEDTPSTKQVGKYSITYTTTENGNGIAIADAENQAVLLTTKAAEFKLADIQPETALSVETGYYEGTKWIKAGEKEFTVTDNILAISASAYECIRITLTEPQPCVKISADYDENGVLINASFEDILTNDITPTENTKTHKTFYWKSLNDMLPIAAAQ